MTTYNYLRFLTLTFCFALGFTLQPLSATEQPNVVFILIDDLSHYGVSAYGATQLNSTQVDTNGDPFFPSTAVRTPKIDQLATDGLLAGNAFAYAICEPTRVALMTGMNNNRNYIQPKALHESQITFGDIFKQAGYATGIAGKWKQSRGTAAIPGKDYVDQFGWDEIYCFDLIGEGARHIDPNFVINGVVTYFKNQNGGIDPVTGRRWYGPDLINRFALNFIEAHQNQPFFLYYSMLLVHDEHTPTPDTLPQSLYDEFETVTYPLGKEDPAYEYGAFDGDDRRYFPDMMAYMDKMIGNIIDKLDALNLRDDTLIVVMGDNGTKASFSYTVPGTATEFIGGKGECRANGLQVPLLLSQPGTISAGSEYNGLINLTDIFPTICEAAGLEIPNADDLDGISFWPQAIGNTATAHRDHIYTWYNANKPMANTTKLIQFAQEIDFKRYAPDENDPQNFPQGRFFDLRSDPLELEDAYNNTVNTGSGIFLRSGLNLTTLTVEQQAAYDRLGTVLANNAEVAATDLGIETTFPTVRYATQFEGSEGFQAGGINNSANFTESSQGGMVLPAGQAPAFGTLQRSPTAGSSRAYYTTGAGASFGVGATWSTTLDFTFEGLPNTAPGTTTLLVANGFSSSNTVNANVMYAAIQKGGGQTEQYQFFIVGGIGGFLQQNISYANIGDDTLDNDDLTDTLRIKFTLTKSAIAGQFDAVATLTNLATNTIVATISNSLNRPDAYSPAKNLYGYINSGAVKEADNFDLLNIDSFTYTATPEPSDQSMSSGKVRINDSVQLQAQVTPANATMRNVVWQSSDSTVASVDKFGIATALQPGEATISLYSWEDARPLASGSSATLDTTGISEQVTIVVNPPLIHTDDDNDGIEDSWENAYFSGLSTVDASSDIDNDGNTDAAEFQAGTDPTDPSSSFRINIQDVSTDFDLSWPSASGRTYSIRMTPDLGQPWTVVENTIAATPPTNARSFTPATSAAFYQITID
jgi:arylsulfatase A